jgi:hypothetical protein
MPKVQHRASAAVHLDDGSRRGLTQASRCGGGRWPRDFRVPEIQQAHTCAGYGDDPAQYWPPAPAQFCARVQEDNQLGLNVDVESGHLEHISSALRENQVLTHLDLSYNNLAARGCAAISEALEENATIKVCPSPPGPVPAGPPTVRPSPLVQELSLRGNNMGDTGAQVSPVLFFALHGTPPHAPRRRGRRWSHRSRRAQS